MKRIDIGLESVIMAVQAHGRAVVEDVLQVLYHNVSVTLREAGICSVWTDRLNSSSISCRRESIFSGEDCTPNST